jgi:uncharacterized tellurite resistance protein B-like protein
MKLLQELKKHLLDSAPLSKNLRGVTSSHDLRLAVTVIALRAAFCDKRLAPEEHKRLLKDLIYEFGMSKKDVELMIEDAHDYQKFDTWVNTYIEFINEEYNVDQRIEVLSLVWRVIAADDFIDKTEQEYVDSLAVRLGLSKEEEREAIDRANL